jgi:hypothetical protein
MVSNKYIFLDIAGFLDKGITITLKFPSDLHDEFKCNLPAHDELFQCLKSRKEYLKGMPDTLPISNAEGVSLSHKNNNTNEKRILEIFEEWTNFAEAYSIKNQIQNKLQQLVSPASKKNNPSNPKVFIRCEDPLLDIYPWRELQIFKFEHSLDIVEIVLSPFRPKDNNDYVEIQYTQGVRVLAIVDKSVVTRESLEVLNNFNNQGSIKLELLYSKIDPNSAENSLQIAKSLRDHKPHILIFFGHGGEYRILGNYNIDDLNIQFNKAIQEGLMIAIVNSCDSFLIGRKMSEFGIRHVVAMSWKIRFEPANVFFRHLIEELIGKRNTVSFSFNEAVAGIKPMQGNHPHVAINPVIYEHIPSQLVPSRSKEHDTKNQQLIHDIVDNATKKINEQVESVNNNIQSVSSKTNNIFFGLFIAILISIGSSVYLFIYLYFYQPKSFSSPTSVLSNNQPSSDNTIQDIIQKTEKITVQVRQAKNNDTLYSSGIIFHKSRDEKTYYVLTTNPSSKDAGDNFTIKIDSDPSYPAYPFSSPIPLPGEGVAVYKFCSTKKDKAYEPLKLADTLKKGEDLHIVGLVSDQSDVAYTYLSTRLASQSNGSMFISYPLSSTRRTINGSPIVNNEGLLVGMQMRGEWKDDFVRTRDDGSNFAQGVHITQLKIIKKEIENYELKDSNSCP